MPTVLTKEESMAHLDIRIETIEATPFFRLFTANGEKLNVCLDYVSGQGEAARGTFDTYRQSVEPGGYWLIVSYGDSATLTKITARDNAPTISDMVARVGGCSGEEAREAFGETRANTEIPPAVADEFIACFDAIGTYHRNVQARAAAMH
jgi:hypothetical protein